MSGEAATGAAGVVVSRSDRPSRSLLRAVGTVARGSRQRVDHRRERRAAGDSVDRS
jgi:hypothetical protein